MNRSPMTAPDDIAGLIARDDAPPVERRHPARCGAIDIVVKRDGTWLHEDRPVTRDRLVVLFSRVLRREPDGAYALVTPAERMTITVEDAPFAFVEARIEGEGRARRIALRERRGDWIEIGPRHPLRLVSTETAFKPYALMRTRLEGLASRSVAQEIAGSIEPGAPGLWAGGVFFPVLA